MIRGPQESVLDLARAYSMASASCKLRSYEAMSAHVGVSPRVLQDMVSGKHSPKLSTLAKLAAAAGVPVSKLLLWAEGGI